MRTRLAAYFDPDADKPLGIQSPRARSLAPSRLNNSPTEYFQRINIHKSGRFARMCTCANGASAGDRIDAAVPYGTDGILEDGGAFDGR